MLNHRFIAATAALALAQPGIAATSIPLVHVVIKFAKGKASVGPAAIFEQDSCPACKEGRDPAFERDNARETLIDLHVPAARFLELAFAARPGRVRRVILETGDVTFREQGGRLLVELPPLHADMVEAGEFATHFVEPGMVFRFEHADPERLAGDYAGKPLPAVQRAAANSIEFAQREAIRQLGLGDYVAREGLGIIEVMGFDTNDPHGHRDSPPHTHMHLRWPFNTGTQIGHFYLSPDGLLQENRVGVTAYRLPTRTFLPGQTFTTIDNRGRPVYAQTITKEGWLELSAVWPGSAARKCLLRPAGTGFQSGAIIACDGQGPVPISVTDDLVTGVLRVRTGGVIETFRYDPDTGRLLSPTDLPPVPEDTILPISRTTVSLPAAQTTAPILDTHD